LDRREKGIRKALWKTPGGLDCRESVTPLEVAFGKGCAVANRFFPCGVPPICY